MHGRIKRQSGEFGASVRKRRSDSDVLHLIVPQRIAQTLEPAFPHGGCRIDHGDDRLSRRTIGNAAQGNAANVSPILGSDADRIIRAYRLYLAGSAMGFERGWTSLFRILVSRPANTTQRNRRADRAHTARHEYPFNRAYMYAQGSNAGATYRGRDTACDAPSE
jgi:hypothetical protein